MKLNAIKKESNILYQEIDECITELLKARGSHDTEAEGKALFKMEGLMVGTLQHLSCIMEAEDMPSNIDEAAEEIVRDWLAYGDGEYKKLVIAGAEWMAGQGVTCEGKVFTSAFTSYVKTPGIEELLKDAFPEDTEVIAQIRKKQ